MLVREIAHAELEQLLSLYTHLHDNKMPALDGEILALWDDIMHDAKHRILVGVADGKIISSCVLMIIPNLTHGQRPYALIENVITHPAYRNKGYATQILQYAKSLAADNGCYKIMLMTGTKESSTLCFYERAGYNQNDKTAFVQWLA